MFEGSVDEVTTIKATGWLYDRAEGRTSDVVALLRGRMLGEGASSLLRPDLEAVGFGDGICGFELGFDEPVRDSDLPFVTVHPKGSNLAIPRTSEDSYKDLIAQIMRLHPSTGRSRTFLGGLWIDRTDALQVLAGRVKVGTCDNAIFPALRTLIADGLLAIQLENANLARDTNILAKDFDYRDSETTESIIALSEDLFSANTVALLQSIFDDIPTIYRPCVLTGEQAGFAQAPSIEPLTSPAEILVGYVLVRGEGRLDYVFDSHDLPEFMSNGVSRWIPGSEAPFPVIAASSQRPIRTVDLAVSTLTLVGPGLVHRVIAAPEASIVRIVATPQRVSPLRFHKENAKWADVALANGLRGRL